MSQQLSRQDRIIPDHIDRFLLDQFDRAGIGHQVFAEKASALLVRSVRLRHVVYHIWLLHNANTRYGWLTIPYPAETLTPQEAPSFAWRTRSEFGIH